MSTEINLIKEQGRARWLRLLGCGLFFIVCDRVTPGFCGDRLPRDVLPNFYDLEVIPNPKEPTFEGKVRIDLTVKKTTREIILNASALELKSWQLTTDQAPHRLYALKKSQDSKAETLTFRTQEDLLPQNYHLVLKYSGKINSQASGLFAVHYSTPEGSKRALFTQFEPADARQFLPCFDEPDFKAQFKVSATVPAGMMALSNMPALPQVPGSLRVEFQVTPPMAPYLLFLGVGDFERKASMVDETEIGVVTQKGVLQQADFALESSVRVVKKYNEYFGIKYPLPKLDNIASPGFSAFFGAMENWGAIFTFEHSLLVDSKTSTEQETMRSFQVAAHEIAHQWFGNLVTMVWWDDLWLNEGFATWLEGKATDWFHPEWRMPLESVLGKEGAKNFDSLSATHPVVQKIKSPAQISQAFDEITYVKGRSVLDMLENYVGDAAWQKGVQSYIERHRFGNATTREFWSAIGEVANHDQANEVLEIATQFTTQPGIPLVRVKQGPCLDGKTTLHLEQGVFVFDEAQSSHGYWKVPVKIRWKSALKGDDPDQLLTQLLDRKLTLTLKGCGQAIVNAGGKGYYRTLYEDFGSIKRVFQLLPGEEQLIVLEDYFAMVRAGRVQVNDYLDWIDTLPLENFSKAYLEDPERGGAPFDPYLILTVVRQARALLGIVPLEEGAVQETFKKAWLKKLEPIMERVGWISRKGESHSLGLLRVALIESLSLFGSPVVLEKAREQVSALMKHEAVETPSMLPLYLSVVAYASDEKEWLKLWQFALAQEQSLIRQKYLKSIFNIKEKLLAELAFNKALHFDSDKTLSSLLIRVLAGAQPDLTFELALKHQGALQKRLDSSSVLRFIPSLTRGSSREVTAKQLKLYIGKALGVSDRGEATNLLEQIELNVKTQGRLSLGMRKWLETQEKAAVKKVLP